MAEIPKWRVQGDWFDTCNCSVPCPCTFAQPPTTGECEGILAWHINKGSYGDVRLDGLSVMKKIRQQRVSVPILLLTARVTVADKVLGLDLGADDYLTKPFAFEELLARVRALLRRGAPAQPAILTIADLRLDPVTREVSRGNKRIDLTAKEFALLEFFLRRRDQVLSRTVIAQHVWGLDYDSFTNVIDVYVNYLRKKIDNGFEPKLIHSVRGVGYVLKEEPSPS